MIRHLTTLVVVVVKMQHARLPVGGDRFESRYGKNYRNSFDHNLLDLDMVIDGFGANRKCSNFPIGKSRLEHLLGKKTKVIGFNFFKYCFYNLRMVVYTVPTNPI